MRRARDDRLDVMNELVADEADGAAREARQGRKGDSSIALQDLFDDLQAVRHAFFALRFAVARNPKLFHDLSILDHLDAVAGLLDDRARVAADEGVAADVLAAFDGFEKERFALPANFAVDREGCFEIGENGAGDGD